MSRYSMQKTACQLMAEHVIHDHIEHYHGSIDLKSDSDAVQFLDNYKGRKGFFIKKFLINDKFNLNNWKVTWEAIQKDIWDFVGKPLVRTPDLDHPPVSIQEDYRVGTIIDVGIDEVNHVAWQVSEIFDKTTQEMIMNKEIEFGSPTVLIRSEATREQKSKGTPFQQDILHRFKPAHDALVGNPAYGKEINVIPAVCTGDGPACAMKLLQVNASVEYRAAFDQYNASARTPEDPETAGYVRTVIPRKCGTCKFFQYPSKCNWPLTIQVDPELDCCNHWDPGDKKGPGDIIYAADVNSDNVSQLTIVPFVRKMLKKRFTAEEMANVITNAKSASSDSCVSRKIKIIADEHPKMPHDQVIAIAYSYCKGDSKEGALEGVFMADLADDILDYTANAEDLQKLEAALHNLENELAAAKDEGYWFTTETGVHIHAGPGESKEDATKRFFKENPQKQETKERAHVVPGKVWKHEPIIVSKKPSKEHIQSVDEVMKDYPKLDRKFAIEQSRKSDEIRSQHEKLAESLRDSLASEHKEAEVTARLKDRSKMIEKLARKPDEYKDVSQLQDVSGLRVVSKKGMNDVKDIVKDIKSKYDVISEDNYLDKPKAGYRSYHLQVKDKKTNLISEIQARTENQDRWATFAHDKVYKISEEDKIKFAQNAEAINSYMMAMSDYYFKLDTGVKVSGKPKCPPAVSKNIGCM